MLRGKQLISFIKLVRASSFQGGQMITEKIHSLEYSNIQNIILHTKISFIIL